MAADLDGRLGSYVSCKAGRIATTGVGRGQGQGQTTAVPAQQASPARHPNPRLHGKRHVMRGSSICRGITFYLTPVAPKHPESLDEAGVLLLCPSFPHFGLLIRLTGLRNKGGAGVSSGAGWKKEWKSSTWTTHSLVPATACAEPCNIHAMRCHARTQRRACKRTFGFASSSLCGYVWLPAGNGHFPSVANK